MNCKWCKDARDVARCVEIVLVLLNSVQLRRIFHSKISIVHENPSFPFQDIFIQYGADFE